MDSYFELTSLTSFAIICGMTSIIAFNGSLKFFNYLIYKYKLKKDDSENKTILTYSDKIKNNNKIRITFENNFKEVIMNCDELEHLDSEWFLSTLVRFKKENSDYDDYGYIHYNTDESHDLIMSIIKSVQYNKLILYDEDINLDLMYAVADKLSCPVSLMKYIEFEIEKRNNHLFIDKYFNKSERVYMFYPFKCKICQQGFTMINNKEGSCHHHPKSIRYDLNTYNCCGKNIDDEGCVKGKHVPDIDNATINLIIELIKNS